VPALQLYAGFSTKVSCGTGSLPRVPGLNGKFTTSTIAAGIVEIAIGSVKPNGWLTAK
jgi:hypothetical protein